MKSKQEEKNRRGEEREKRRRGDKHGKIEDDIEY
jgi:hypothetical protein